MLCGMLGCAAQTKDFRSVEAEEFAGIIADSTNAVTLLDVRTAAEYAEGHIGAAINIDVLANGFEEEAIKRITRERPVAVYCRSGRRSKKAAGILVKNGYEVIELNSGYIGWTEKHK